MASSKGSSALNRLGISRVFFSENQHNLDNLDLPAPQPGTSKESHLKQILQILMGHDEQPQNIRISQDLRSKTPLWTSSLQVTLSQGVLFRGPGGSAIMRHAYINILKNARELLKPQHYRIYRHGFSSVPMLMSVASINLPRPLDFNMTSADSFFSH